MKINFLSRKYLFYFLLSTFIMIHLQAQTEPQIFKLGVREYRLVEGKWYNFSSGRKGDQIVPDRLVVRLKDRSDLRRFDFSHIGLHNLEIVSN